MDYQRVINDFGFALETPPGGSTQTEDGNIQPSEWLGYFQLLTVGTEDQMSENIRVSEISITGLIEFCEILEIKQ